MEIFMKFQTEDQMKAYTTQWYWNLFKDKRLFAVNNNSHNRIAGNIQQSLGVRRGVTDLIFLGMDKVYFIEQKLPGEKQSPDQIEFQNLCEELGHAYMIHEYFEQTKDFILNLIEHEYA